MADLNKPFLDYEGLKEYDSLIKNYIKTKSASSESVDEFSNALEELKSLYNTDVAANTSAIEKLNSNKDTEGSVDYKINQAISDLIANAPESYDTLKEIADWISNDETGTAALVSRIEALEAGTTDSEKEYIDNQDEYYFNLISNIEDLKIHSLFPVIQDESQTVAEAIAALDEGEAIKLIANQTISDDITINKNCYIDGNGSTFTGIISVPSNKNVIIENATLSNSIVKIDI